MLSDEEKNKLLTQVQEKKKEIRDIKDTLNSLNNQKESWFKKKEAVSKNISDLIKKVKESKDQRNNLTSHAHDSKKKRDEFNTVIKNKIDELKKMEAKKKEILDKSKIKGNPFKIKMEIDALERKIETIPMPFEAEKKIMKQINERKKMLIGSKEILEVVQQVKRMSKEIDTLKRDANLSHSEIQNYAKVSQLSHEEMMGKSKQIDEIKKQEEEAFQKFVEFKKQFNEINDKLKVKLTELNELIKLLGENNVKVEQEKEGKRKDTITSMEKQVEEKIKQKRKLTTEDLLIMQFAEQNKNSGNKGRGKKPFLPSQGNTTVADEIDVD